MWRKIRFATIFLLLTLAFLGLTETGTRTVGANLTSYLYESGGVVPADNSTNPPTITIYYEKDITYTNSTISIPIHVIVGESTTAKNPYINEIYFSMDGATNYTSIYKYEGVSWNMSEPKPDNFYNPPETKKQLSTNLNLTNLSEGKHSLTVYAVENGTYAENKVDSSNPFGYVTVLYSFQINSSSLASFTVDTIPPKIWLSIENSTYHSSELPLDFKVDDSYAQISYSLDNQPNATLSENIILTDLTLGSHSLAVFAKDDAGNFASQIITFNVAEPFPMMLVTISVIVLCVGLIVLFSIALVVKHRKTVNPKQ